MASRPDPLIAVAGRLILSLYDGGVLSPAVLERVLASLGDIRWDTAADTRASDGRSLPEVVVAVMMPGNALDNVDQDFAAVIDHIGGMTREAEKPVKSGGTRAAGKPRKGAAAPPADSSDDADAELLDQLAGMRDASNRKTRPSRANSNTRSASGFSPLQNAAPPKKR
jgi:hypothetical protein